MKSPLLPLVVVLAACAPDRTPLTAPDAPLPPPLRAVIPVAAVQRPQEQKFVALAAAVPAFGGYYYERGDLVIALTDTTDGARAAALVARAGTGSVSSAHRGKGRTGRTRIVPARYTFLQLKAWRDALFGELMESDSVEFLDLDEQRQQVRVGVGHAVAARWVEALAEKAGVPAGALAIDTVPPAQTFATLRDRVRPVRAGLQIFQRDQFLCTLGYAISFVGNGGIANGFLTNSHCTDTFWGLDAAAQFQIAITAVDSIGREVRDPAGFACGYRGRKTCRYSDASILGDVTGNRLQGRVLRLVEVTDGDGEFGSTEIVERQDLLVTSVSTSSTVGDIHDKVGTATGWTSGEVTHTCVDLRGTTTKLRLLCQDESHTFAFSGDSGSPVFVFQGTTIEAHGILWGGRVHALRRSDTFVSPLENVILDMGGMTPLVLP